MGSPQQSMYKFVIENGRFLLYFPNFLDGDFFGANSQQIMRDQNFLRNLTLEFLKPAIEGAKYDLSLPLAEDIGELAKAPLYERVMEETQSDPLSFRFGSLMTNNAVCYTPKGILVVDRPVVDANGLGLPRGYSVDDVLSSGMEESFGSEQGNVLLPRGIEGIRVVKGYKPSRPSFYSGNFVKNPLIVAIFNDESGLESFANRTINSGKFSSLYFFDSDRPDGDGAMHPVLIHRDGNELKINTTLDFLRISEVPISILRLDEQRSTSISSDVRYNAEIVERAIRLLSSPDVVLNLDEEQISRLEAIVRTRDLVARLTPQYSD